jgi:hypothetical protein
MRYYWGSAIGHVYAHGKSQSGAPTDQQDDEDVEGDAEAHVGVEVEAQGLTYDAGETENVEYSLEPQDDDILDHLGVSDMSDNGEGSDIGDD